jgi:hypothetical protein
MIKTIFCRSGIVYIVQWKESGNKIEHVKRALFEKYSPYLEFFGFMKVERLRRPVGVFFGVVLSA